MNEELDRLRTAFVLDMTKRVIDADGKVVFSEIRFWSRVFPSDLLRSLGFIDDDNGFTDALLEAQMEAAIRLPAELDLAQKLSIVDALHEACMADNVAEEAELEVVREAARILGLPDAEVNARLETLSSL